MPKPPLGPVKVGDRLLVIPAARNNRIKEPVEVTVTKVGRIWAEFAEVDGPRSWRLRLDTQHDGGAGSVHDRFVTFEQRAWENRMRLVDAELFDAGIRIDHSSPWREEERRIALANFIRQHNGLGPL